MQIMQLCLGFLLEQVDTYYWFKLCSRVLEAHGLAAIDMEQYLGYYNDYHVRMFQYNASCRLSEILENGQIQVTTDQTDQMSKLKKKKNHVKRYITGAKFDFYCLLQFQSDMGCIVVTSCTLPPFIVIRVFIASLLRSTLLFTIDRI